MYKEMQFKNIKFVLRYSPYDIAALFILMSTIILQVNLLSKVSLFLLALAFDYIGWVKYKTESN